MIVCRRAIECLDCVISVRPQDYEALWWRKQVAKLKLYDFAGFITMWNGWLFCLGGNPYPGHPANEVYQYLMEGHRMDIPHDCPDEM